VARITLLSKGKQTKSKQIFSCDRKTPSKLLIYILIWFRGHGWGCEGQRWWGTREKVSCCHGTSSSRWLFQSPDKSDFFLQNFTFESTFFSKNSYLFLLSRACPTLTRLSVVWFGASRRVILTSMLISHFKKIFQLERKLHWQWVFLGQKIGFLKFAPMQ
jgi:hypothetical protein